MPTPYKMPTYAYALQNAYLCPLKTLFVKTATTTWGGSDRDRMEYRSGAHINRGHGFSGEATVTTTGY